MVHAISGIGERVWAALGSEVVRLQDGRIEARAPGKLLRLGLASDGKHVVGLGAEAKTVVVLDAETLVEVAVHEFPKRPSAWATTGSTLIVADKFGDVFAVDLLVPQRLRQDGAEQKQLLEPILGHVSMVLAVAATPTKVLSSDRDEHIRVSELPAAYNIDRFLLGHESYVSHLALSGSQLLSAGGDPFVIAWDWTTGEELARLDVAAAVGRDAPIDVISTHIDADGKAWLAVEGVSKLVKASFPELAVEEVVDLPAGPLDIAAPYVALPTGVLNTATQAFAEVGGESDPAEFSQANFRKTNLH